MRKIILLLGLMGFLTVSTSVCAVENPIVEPEPEIWLMSIEICKKFEPQIEDAVKRGVVFLPRQCKWFGMGERNPFRKNELAVWPTFDKCINAPITPPDGYILRTRNCQRIEQ
tara:strand:- start:415 stop:753 length:339 start_codon:yes stop_codon:yes gene_type:complete